MTEAFPAEWLALREPFDAAARSVTLASRLAALLPARPRVLELGAGNGGLFRWLAPRLARPQAWLLVDADKDLLRGAFEACEAWAVRQGWTVTWPGRALLVHTPVGAWRLEARCADLAHVPAGLPFGSVDVVASSALLGFASAAWVKRLVAALATPIYATLNIDGRDAMLPRHPLDARIATAFRRDQGCDRGLGRALGPRAPAALHAALAGRGFAVLSAPSAWRVPPQQLPMLSTLVDGYADAAVRAMPGRARTVEAWRVARMRAALEVRLAIRVGRRDSLGLPPA
jgi:SAM-dependent methyltransferase